MVGPILLPKKAEECRQQLAEWASANRVEGVDFTVDYYGHRTYEVALFQDLAESFLQTMGREVRHTGSDGNGVNLSRAVNIKCIDLL